MIASKNNLKLRDVKKLSVAGNLCQKLKGELWVSLNSCHDQVVEHHPLLRGISSVPFISKVFMSQTHSSQSLVA
jgi:hypothetical protein